MFQASGWIKLEGVYSEKDVEMARERVMYHTNTEFYMEKWDFKFFIDRQNSNYHLIRVTRCLSVCVARDIDKKRN